MSKTPKRIQYKIDKNFIANYDEILNCQLNKTYMDTGFLDNDKLSIGPRSYMEDINTSSYTARKSDIFFYTDKTNTVMAFSMFSNTVNGTRDYGLYYATVSTNGTLGAWTLVTGSILTSATPLITNPKFNFSTVQAPAMNSGSVFPCATVNVSTVVDRLKRNTITDIDANTGNRSGANAIGKILQIISEESYTGVYAFVTGYDAITDEYILEGSGAIIPFRVATQYGIYDRLVPTLQLKSNYFLDRYYDGITEDGQLRGLATYSLRKTTFLSPTEFISDQILFNNAYWTYTGGTILESKGFPGNPFYYTLVSGQTISKRNITGLYVYKNRLMVYGKDFLYGYSTSKNIERLSESIGVKDNAIFSTGDDLYGISVNKRIYSINELSSGTLYIKNITKQLSNYTENFVEDCFIHADNRNIYFGGNASSSGSFVNFTYLLVYSLEYKYWSIYSVPTVCGASSYNGIIYFTDRYASRHMAFGWDLNGFSYNSSLSEKYVSGVNSTTLATLTEADYTQRISTRWNDNGDIFLLKQTGDINLFLDNVRNDIGVTQFMIMDEKIGSRPKKIFSLTQLASTSLFGTGVTGQEIVGGASVAVNTLVPRLKRIEAIKDPCNAIKIVCESVASNGFHLAGLSHDMEINTSTNDYKNPNGTN